MLETKMLNDHKQAFISVSRGVRQLIKGVQDAWNGSGSRRLSQQNVIEILVKLAPGKFTQAEVDAVELSTKPPGRPRKRKREFI